MFNNYSIKKILILLSVSSVICDPLRKVPKIYNAVITSSDNLQPSKAYPVIQPVVQPAAVAYHVHYPHLHHSGSYVNFFQQHIYENPDSLENPLETNPSKPKPAERYGFIQIQTYHSPETDKRTQRRLDNPPPTLNAAYSPPSQSSNLLQSLYHSPQKSNPTLPNPDSDPLLHVLQMVGARSGNKRLSNILHQSHRETNDSKKIQKEIQDRSSTINKHPVFPTGLHPYEYTILDSPPLPSGSGNNGNQGNEGIRGNQLNKLKTTYQVPDSKEHGNPQGDRTIPRHKHPFQTGLHPYEYTILDSPPLSTGSGNHGNPGKQLNKPHTTYLGSDQKGGNPQDVTTVKENGSSTDFQASGQTGGFHQEQGFQSGLTTEGLPNVGNRAILPKITYLKSGPKESSLPQGVSTTTGSSSTIEGFQTGSPLQTITGYYGNQEILPQNTYLTPSPKEISIPQRIITTKTGSSNRGPNSQGILTNAGSTNGRFQMGYPHQSNDGLRNGVLPNGVYPNKYLQNVSPGTIQKYGNPQESFINGGYSGGFPGSHGVPQFLEPKGNDGSLLEVPQGYGSPTTVFPVNPLQSSVAPGVVPTVLGPHDLVPEGSPLENLQGDQSQPFFGDYHYPVDSLGSSTPTIGTSRSTSVTNHNNRHVTSSYGKTFNKGATTSPTSLFNVRSSTLEPIGANTVQNPQVGGSRSLDNQNVTSKYGPVTGVPTTSEPLGANTIQMPQFGDILNNHFRDKYPNIPDVPPPPLPTARKKL